MSINERMECYVSSSVFLACSTKLTVVVCRYCRPDYISYHVSTDTLTVYDLTLVLASTAAPLVSSALTTETWPCCAAVCRHIAPFLFGIIRGTPFFNKAIAVSGYPKIIKDYWFVYIWKRNSLTDKPILRDLVKQGQNTIKAANIWMTSLIATKYTDGTDWYPAIISNWIENAVFKQPGSSIQFILTISRYELSISC